MTEKVQPYKSWIKWWSNANPHCDMSDQNRHLVWSEVVKDHNAVVLVHKLSGFFLLATTWLSVTYISLHLVEVGMNWRWRKGPSTIHRHVHLVVLGLPAVWQVQGQIMILLAILMVIMQGLKEKTKMFVIYVVFAKKMAKSFQVDELVISQYIFGLQ